MIRPFLAVELIQDFLGFVTIAQPTRPHETFEMGLFCPLIPFHCSKTLNDTHAFSARGWRIPELRSTFVRRTLRPEMRRGGNFESDLSNESFLKGNLPNIPKLASADVLERWFSTVLRLSCQSGAKANVSHHKDPRCRFHAPAVPLMQLATVIEHSSHPIHSNGVHGLARKSFQRPSKTSKTPRTANILNTPFSTE